MTTPCLHLGASSLGYTLGYTEARIQDADASMAGMVLFAGVCTCPRCGALVVSVSLHPKAGPPILRTDGPVPLVPPRPVTMPGTQGDPDGAP